jgi:Lrp/AsnC family transcriptional regulator, leucine-responsive regulatory protein
MTLDRYDARILDELQRDGRCAVVDLATRIGLSATPCNRRIRNMETAGVIEGYTALVDPGKVGLKAQAFVQVKLERHSDEIVAAFERELGGLEEVLNCFATTGSHDFLLQVVASDLDALSNVVLKKLLKIPGVRDVHSSIVLDTIKRSSRLPLHHLRS